MDDPDTPARAIHRAAGMRGHLIAGLPRGMGRLCDRRRRWLEGSGVRSGRRARVIPGRRQDGREHGVGEGIEHGQDLG